MRGSLYRLHADLSAALLALPPVIAACSRKEPRAADDLLAWLGQAETLLLQHRLVQAAELSGLKARVIAAADAGERGGQRRRRIAAALDIAHPAQAAIRDAMQPAADRIAQARAIARQLLHVVARSGFLRYNPGDDFAAFVDALWAACSGHEQLRPATLQLGSLLGRDDIRLLLAEEVDPAEFSG